MDSLDRRQGLSSEQVAQRVRDGLSNADEGIKTKTEKQIILENTFTFFNILNFVLALFVLLVGSFKNLLFLGVIFSNIIIGSFQGIRAKRTIDKLSHVRTEGFCAARRKTADDTRERDCDERCAAPFDRAADLRRRHRFGGRSGSE